MFVAGLFMSIMDSTIVNTALPAIAASLRTSTTWMEWVVVGYLLSLAVWIPASGWIGDRWGTKPAFLMAIGIFTGASVLCGLAGSAGELILFRVVQGIGGGMLAPIGTSMLFRAFPPERRAQAAAILIVPTAVAPALGPVLGGALVEAASWRWIFFVNVPIGIATFVFGARLLADHREPDAGSFDLPGFALAGLGLSLLLFALTQTPTLGLRSPWVIATAAGGAVAIVALVGVELRHAQPILRLRLLEGRLFGRANLSSFFGLGSYMGLLFVMPLFLQVGRGASPLESGLTTFPEAVGVIVSSRLVARLYGRIGPRRLIAGGMVGTAAVMLVCAQFDLATNDWLIRTAMFIAGCMMAFVFLPLNAATFAGIASADTGRASAIFNAQRRVASATGVAILASILTASDSGLAGLAPTPGTPSHVAPFHLVFLVDGVLALVGAAVALSIHDSDAAETMVVRPKADGAAAGSADGGIA